MASVASDASQTPTPAPDGPPRHAGILESLRDEERRVLDRVRGRRIAAQNVNAMHAERMSTGERLADDLARLAGSWRFILGFLSLIGLWVILNTVQLLFHAFDPYPFILLNLFLSLLAGLQAPVIMMSQNRQEERDRLRAENDYEVNLKAELEIEQLHQKMDALREQQWQELLDIQQHQIELLHEQIELLRSSVGTSRPSSAPASD